MRDGARHVTGLRPRLGCLRHAGSRTHCRGARVAAVPHPRPPIARDRTRSPAWRFAASHRAMGPAQSFRRTFRRAIRDAAAGRGPGGVHRGVVVHAAPRLPDGAAVAAALAAREPRQHPGRRSTRPHRAAREPAATRNHRLSRRRPHAPGPPRVPAAGSPFRSRHPETRSRPCNNWIHWRPHTREKSLLWLQRAISLHSLGRDAEAVKARRHALALNPALRPTVDGLLPSLAREAP